MADASYVQVVFPDGRVVQVPAGTEVAEVLRRYDPDRVSEILLLRSGDQYWDHHSIVDRDLQVDELITPDHPKALEVYRHSCAHLLAQAVQQLFPETKLAVGPPIENGFYYDFLRDRPFTEEDLARIERRMKELAEQDIPIVHKWLPKEEALQYFESRGEIFKVELIHERGGDPVSCYQQAEFLDFCKGPHVPSTGYLKALKVLSTSGAYWRGDERNPQLQRIYGTCFPTEAALVEYLHQLEEARRRDHRRLGAELDLFSVQDSIGPGLILWHPKGAVIRRQLEEFLYEAHFRRGYQVVYTPHVARLEHWRVSGHLDFYRDYMFPPMELEERVPYQLKPMNCPFHIVIYKSRRRSYRELPVRLFEFGTVYRYERSGVLHGLLRVRGFTQDDSHIFCTQDQIEAEILGVLDFIREVLGTFGFHEYKVYLSTRPEKYVGTLEAWEVATRSLQQALEGAGLAYEVDPGEGVFYGPKIDVKIRDAIGRWWQCSTVQVDFNLPERFDLTYVGPDGHPHRVTMIHRAILGSMERFMGVLIENFAGAFPFWVAPVQARVLPISDRHADYARRVQQRLSQQGFRVEVDLRDERVSAKVRDAELEKVPFIFVVGDREAAQETVAVRVRGLGDQGPWPVAQMEAHFHRLRASRRLDLWPPEE